MPRVQPNIQKLADADSYDVSQRKKAVNRAQEVRRYETIKVKEELCRETFGLGRPPSEAVGTLLERTIKTGIIKYGITPIIPINSS